MEARHERMVRARELERLGDPRAALALFLQLAAAEEGPAAAALWSRAGDLQRSAGEPDAAASSFRRAVELFAAAEQLNNALAAALKLAAVDPSAAPPGLGPGELALRKGYRTLAHEVTGAAARGAAPEDLEETVGTFDAFLARYPDETDLWSAWARDLAAAGREEEAVEGLRRLLARASQRGDATAERNLRSGLDAIRPDPASPPAEAAAPPAGDAGRAPSSSDPSSASAESALEIAPLAGFEPTHADLSTDAPDEEPVTALDPLPLLEADGSRRAIAPPLAAGDRSADPLPLLEPDGSRRIADPSAANPATDPLPLLRPDPDPSVHAAAAGAGAFRDGHLDPPSDPAVLPLPGPAAGHASTAGIPAIAARLRASSSVPVPPTDAASHYDLGVALREMGLLDEALAHLAGALSGGHDPLAVLEIAGAILLERGDPDGAVAALEDGLHLAAPDAPGTIGARYWLARGEEARGRRSAAIRALEEVVDADPAFLDAADRLARLRVAGF